MAFIIDKTYFDGGELNIPGTETEAVSERIDDFIAKYEPEYLIRALGYPLYKLFKADGTYPTPTSQRFLDMLNGNVEYTGYNGYTQLWGGLKTMFNSPIADYVWYWYQRNNATLTASTGEVKGRSENSENVSIQTKQMRAYNEMNAITCQLWDFLAYYKIDDEIAFPEFDKFQTKPFGVLTTFNI